MIEALHSGLPAAEQRKIEAAVASGEIRILIVSLERLRSLAFVLSLKRAANGRGVSLFVVDEAHCTSEWGHSFRPEYLFIRKVIEDLGHPPVLALTATADPRVREDVVGLLGMKDARTIVTGFDRPNLTYAARKVPDGPVSSRTPYILEALRAGEAPAIVYAHTRSDCVAIAVAIATAITADGSATGITAEAYHAGMGASERAAVQERFMNDETSVVVATVAFGMGVDKPNIRSVIHASVPASIPAYVQEAGRAGRDGEPAACTVLFSADEVSHRKKLAHHTPTTTTDATRYFAGLTALAPADARANAKANARINIPAATLEHLADLDTETAGGVLRALEGIGAIERRYNLWESVAVKNLKYPVGERQAPQQSQRDSQGPVDRVRDALHDLLPEQGAGYGGKATGKARKGRRAATTVSLLDLARAARVTAPVAQGALMRLAADGELEASGRGVLADVIIRTSALSSRDLALLEERFVSMANSEARHINDVEDYTSLTSCRRVRLLSYFGDETAAIVAPCDGCDICQGRSQANARLEQETSSVSGSAEGSDSPFWRMWRAVCGEA